MLQLLLSNDDGVYAKGLAILAQSLKQYAEIRIIAPDRDRSGASNSLTLNAPLYIKHLDNGMISVEGTPTDCVHVGITGLLDKQPDMVIAGINAGANLGDDVWYSGTVAAAMEGRFLGFPAMAISLAGKKLIHYETAGKVAAQLISCLTQHPLPGSIILNINVPDIPFGKLNGFEITRLGKRHIAEPTIAQQDPRGNTVYWIGPAGKAQDAGQGTDFYAINQGKVSITPLQVNLTGYENFELLSQWLSKLESIDPKHDKVNHQVVDKKSTKI